jgi:hypothetical protein
MNRTWKKLEDNSYESACGCWIWTGARNNNGYGVTHDFGAKKSVLVHRWVVEQAIGPIPKGLDVHHLCGVRACFNPWHLELLPHRSNLLASPTNFASVNARKTACPKGHPYPEGKRRCRICRREQARESQSRRRLARAA